VKILLLGKNGGLGWELQRTLAPLGAVVAPAREELDLSNFDALRRTIRDLRPDVVVNAAAYTAVDRAESEPEKAHGLNAVVPGLLAEECAALRALLIHYSTDYVFDGEKGAPYVETDAPRPLNVYGQSKLAGEAAVQAADGNTLILRTAWVYSLRRDSFVTRVLEWARRKDILRIVSDQVSNPTWARPLAEATAQILGRGVAYVSERRGLYHLAGQGYASRQSWAQEILRLDSHPAEQAAREVLPAATAEFPAPAVRPRFSALDCTKFANAFGLGLPDWRQSLGLAMGEPIKQ
jgi:dTDP-4-dehydrorhamnose reductase